VLGCNVKLLDQTSNWYSSVATHKTLAQVGFGWLANNMLEQMVPVRNCWGSVKDLTIDPVHAYPTCYYHVCSVSCLWVCERTLQLKTHKPSSQVGLEERRELYNYGTVLGCKIKLLHQTPIWYSSAATHETLAQVGSQTICQSRWFRSGLVG
jgi:hypothetical protein